MKQTKTEKTFLENWIHSYVGEDKTKCGLDSVERSTLLQSKVTCIKCLRLIEKEWKKQIKQFTGHSQINAKKGLERTIKQLEKLNDH